MRKLSESVWMDIHKHSVGDIDRKEDDINNLSPEEFFQYLKDNYENDYYLDEVIKKDGITKNSKRIEIPLKIFKFPMPQEDFDEMACITVVYKFIENEPLTTKFYFFIQNYIDDVEYIVNEIEKKFTVEAWGRKPGQIYRPEEKKPLSYSITKKNSKEATHKMIIDFIELIIDTVKEPDVCLFKRK